MFRAESQEAAVAAEKKTPSQSQVEMTQIVLAGQANSMGNAFGGQIMQWIDIAAAVAARRHCTGVAVTASMDGLSFKAPIRLGDVVVLKASVNRSWRTSMEVGVRVEAEHPDGTRVHSASAYLTFVALDSAGRPRPVPLLEPSTPEEERRFREAGERRAKRLA